MRNLLIALTVCLTLFSFCVQANNVIANDEINLPGFQINEVGTDIYLDPGQSFILNTVKPGSQAKHYLTFYCYYPYHYVSGEIQIAYYDNKGMDEVRGQCTTSKGYQTYIIKPHWNNTPNGLVSFRSDD